MGFLGPFVLDRSLKNPIIQALVKKASSVLRRPAARKEGLVKKMQKTYLPTTKDIQRKWWILDAKDQVLGRLTSQVAAILRGKHKTTFTPHVENGDHVVIINAEKIVLTGKKWDTKAHHRTSGRPGGLSTENYKQLRLTKPERILEYAIKGMLPKTSQGDHMFGRLNIYKGETHPHAAQKPEPLTLKYNATRGGK